MSQRIDPSGTVEGEDGESGKRLGKGGKRGKDWKIEMQNKEEEEDE
jgi:hypothetical protein